MKTLFSLIVPLALTLSAAFAGEEVIKDSQGMDCFVYTPETTAPGTTYQLVVGVHGAGGKGNGAAGMKGWAERGDVIVIGPSFETKGERPYQNGDGPHAEKLIALFDELKKQYKLRDKMFLHGFSGGSQFAHRFAMNYPKYVCGVSAHSGGSWATDNYGDISNSAKKIPFAISCGDNDAAKSFPEAPFTRIEWYGRFRDEIDKKGFCYIGASWPGVGHGISPGVWDFARQCFQLATGLPGKSATEEAEISGEWKNLDAIPRIAPPTKPEPPAVPTIPGATAQAAFGKADSEAIPDDKLIIFMRKYPPAVWKEKPGAVKLLKQCEGAAKRWFDAAGGEKMNASAKQDFGKFSEGLDIP
jgi:poly(3-hydroxybutyrate) depolymerase